MNKEQLNKYFESKNLNLIVNPDKIIRENTVPIWRANRVITLSRESANSCCGVNEFGRIHFGSRWVQLSKETRLNIMKYLLPQSKKFSIIYTLENSESWTKFNDLLPEVGFIPLSRWKGMMGRMIQAWHR